MRFPGAHEREHGGAGETTVLRAVEASMLRLAAGVNPGGVGGTLKSPEIRIIVEDHRIIVKSGGKTATATLSKGGNAPVIAALGAGAANMLASSHAASASHQ